MAASSKPPITLKIVIQTFGKRDDVADLFDQLSALDALDRSQDIVLNVGYYFEEQARAVRNQVHELLKTHPAVLRSKSGAHLTTKLMADEVLLEPGEENEDDEEEEDETPIERALRDLAPDGHGVSEVTLSSGGRTVTLTPETRANAERALRSLSWPATAGADDDE